MKAMKQRIIYIGGKVSKPSKFRFNTLWRYYVSTKFKIVEIYLVFMGYEVINPVNVIGQDTTWEDAMDICLNKLLPRCDYVYFMLDWNSSTGSRLEIKQAKKLGKPLLNCGKKINKFYNGKLTKIIHEIKH